MLGNGRQALADSLDIVTAELEQLIDRHFAARRELVVSNDEGKFWTAAIGDNVLYRNPDGRSVLRFAKTFAERTVGVEVVLSHEAGRDILNVDARAKGIALIDDPDAPDRFSVRVPALRVVL